MDLPVESDENLMMRFGRGEAAAFETLYHRHESRLFRYLYRQLHDQASADDLMQEVWFAVARNARNYEPSARFTTWLFTLARNRMIDLLREVLARQRGLHLVSLTNLPPRSLAKTSAVEDSGPVRGNPAGIADPGAAQQPQPKDPGPFLHPVEIVVEGDYLAVAAYLHELERLPWKIHWDRLEVDARHSPDNRVRIVIGALSLSPEWITV